MAQLVLWLHVMMNLNKESYTASKKNNNFQPFKRNSNSLEEAPIFSNAFPYLIPIVLSEYEIEIVL